MKLNAKFMKVILIILLVAAGAGEGLRQAPGRR